MTREEEINNASYTYWANNYANIEFIDEEERELHTQDIQESFINGAEWADAHPQWISVEDKLPPGRQLEGTLSLSIDCVVYIDRRGMGIPDVRRALYDYNEKRWRYSHWSPKHKVTHWMPLPAPPKKGE